MNSKQYAQRQAKPLRGLRKLVRAVLHSLGVPVNEPQVQEVSQRLWRPVVAARAENYRVARTYLDTLDLPPRIEIPRPGLYPFDAITNAVQEMSDELRVNGEPVTQANRRDSGVIKIALSAIESPLSRQALEPARTVVQEIAEDDGDDLSVGWARELVGARSCGFCAMLASRGPVYKSYESAKGRAGNPLDAYHTAYVDERGVLVGGTCDCIAVLVVSWRSWEGRAAFERLENLWDETGGKASGDAARKAFRREWDKQVRAGETGKYLPESLKPKAA